MMMMLLMITMMMLMITMMIVISRCAHMYIMHYDVVAVDHDDYVVDYYDDILFMMKIVMVMEIRMMMMICI